MEFLFMVEEQIRDTLSLRLKKLGYHLIRVKLININTKKTLQIMAERIKDKKMDIEDCVFLSKHISTFLEVYDPISSSYVLEVSSGGLARPLTMIDDYEQFKYNKAKIYANQLGRNLEALFEKRRITGEIQIQTTSYYLRGGKPTGIHRKNNFPLIAIHRNEPLLQFPRK